MRKLLDFRLFWMRLVRESRKHSIFLAKRILGVLKFVSESYVLLFCIFIILGIVISFLFESFCAGLIFTGLLWGVLIAWNIMFHKEKKVLRSNIVIALTVMTIGLGVASIRVYFLYEKESNIYNQVASEIGKAVEMVGVVQREPEMNASKTKYVLNLSEINGQKVNDVKVLVSYNRYPKIAYGSECFVSGVLEYPEAFNGFDYAKYLKTKNIYLVVRYPELSCVDSAVVESGVHNKEVDNTDADNTDVVAGISESDLHVDSEADLKMYPESFWSNIYSTLYSFKQILIGEVQKSLPEPQSSLLIGLILGDRRVFSEEFELSLRRAGVSHVVAASGYNVSFVIMLGNALFFAVKYRWRVFLLFALIWIYCVVSGLSASIVRATIMASFVLSSQLFGQKSLIHNTIFYSVALFCFVNPYVLFDVGFQLSIGATVGLVYLLPIFGGIKIFGKDFSGSSLFQLACSSTACTIMTMPITVSSFGNFSLLGVLANIMVLPMIESSMFIGLLAVVIKLIFPFLGFLSSFLYEIVWIQLKYFEVVVDFIGKLGFASIEIGGGEVGWSSLLPIVMYFFVAILILFAYPKDGISKYNYYFK